MPCPYLLRMAARPAQYLTGATVRRIITLVAVAQRQEGHGNIRLDATINAEHLRLRPNPSPAESSHLDPARPAPPATMDSWRPFAGYKNLPKVWSLRETRR
jgi:hypothetical protein